VLTNGEQYTAFLLVKNHKTKEQIQ